MNVVALINGRKVVEQDFEWILHIFDALCDISSVMVLERKKFVHNSNKKKEDICGISLFLG